MDNNQNFSPEQREVLKPNQPKSVDNQKPTDNPDIRMSLSLEGEQPSKKGTPLSALHFEGHKEDIVPVKKMPVAKEVTEKEELVKQKRTTLKTRIVLIAVMSALVIIAAALIIILPNVFKEEKQTVRLVNEKGDYVFSYVRDYTGRSIAGELEAMAAGTVENEWNVEKGTDGKTAYTFNLDGVKIEERPFIFKEIPAEEIKSVTVTNKGGTFRIYDYEGAYMIEGAESNLYNDRSISSLIFQSRYMLSQQYIENPGKLSDYGLDGSNCLATVTVTEKNGKSQKIIVGNPIYSGTGIAGYYIKHADKDYVYVMDSGVEIFMCGIREYLSPVVIKPIEEHQRNYIEKFAIAKGGIPFFACRILEADEQKGVYANQLHRMTYPEPEFVLSTDKLYSMFYQVGALSGALVMEYGVSTAENKDEIMEKYGLVNAVANISFSHAGTNYEITVGKLEQLYGTYCYYVYSSYQDTIVAVPAEKLSFLQYDLKDFYQPNVFQYNINEIASVDVSYDGNSYKYKLEGTGKELKVTETNSKKIMDTDSFRQFYISLMNITIGGYSSLEGFTGDELLHELTFTVHFKNGEQLIYEFYSESTTNCYMIADGKGGFKTSRRLVTAIKENSDKLMAGEKIENYF